MVDLGLPGDKEDIMPNWCEGTLRIRGTVENLRNFIENGLKPVNAIGEKEDPLMAQLNEVLGENEKKLDMNNI